MSTSVSTLGVSNVVHHLNHSFCTSNAQAHSQMITVAHPGYFSAVQCAWSIHQGSQHVHLATQSICLAIEALCLEYTSEKLAAEGGVLFRWPGQHWSCCTHPLSAASHASSTHVESFSWSPSLLSPFPLPSVLFSISTATISSIDCIQIHPKMNAQLAVSIATFCNRYMKLIFARSTC